MNSMFSVFGNNVLKSFTVGQFSFVVFDLVNLSITFLNCPNIGNSIDATQKKKKNLSIINLLLVLVINFLSE